MRLRPFFGYYGGKWRLAPRYPAPRHATIVEPFAGSASYALLHHDRRVVLVEKDHKVATTWRYLLSATPEQVLALPDLKVGQSTADLGICEGAQYLIGWWCGFAQHCPRRTMHTKGREWEAKGYRRMWGQRVRERIAEQLPAIAHWSLIEGSYEQAPNITATWFVDPPYVGKAGQRYRTSFDQHTELAQWCHSRAGQVVVCEAVGATWLPFEPLATQTGHQKRMYMEAVWCNHPRDEGGQMLLYQQDPDAAQ